MTTVWKPCWPATIRWPTCSVTAASPPPTCRRATITAYTCRATASWCETSTFLATCSLLTTDGRTCRTCSPVTSASSALFDTEFGPMAQILVGATIVGSIETVWSGTVTPPREGIKTLDLARWRQRRLHRLAERPGDGPLQTGFHRDQPVCPGPGGSWSTRAACPARSPTAGDAVEATPPLNPCRYRRRRDPVLNTAPARWLTDKQDQG